MKLGKFDGPFFSNNVNLQFLSFGFKKKKNMSEDAANAADEVVKSTKF